MMKANTELLEPGDRVRDPMDGEIRTVERVENGESVYMTDGGVMGIEECGDVYLPSETIQSILGWPNAVDSASGNMLGINRLFDKF